MNVPQCICIMYVLMSCPPVKLCSVCSPFLFVLTIANFPKLSYISLQCNYQRTHPHCIFDTITCTMYFPYCIHVYPYVYICYNTKYSMYFMHLPNHVSYVLHAFTIVISFTIVKMLITICTCYKRLPHSL